MPFSLRFANLLSKRRKEAQPQHLLIKQTILRRLRGMKRETFIAILLFFFGVLLFTRIDFLVNVSLYGHGLAFSEDWYVEYINLYVLCYQFLIFSLLIYARNLKLFVLMEVFVLSATHDLVYFGVWHGAFPQVEWSWMPFYRVFGTWTTAHQILYSVCANSLVWLAFMLLPIVKQGTRFSKFKLDSKTRVFIDRVFNIQRTFRM